MRPAGFVWPTLKDMGDKELKLKEFLEAIEGRLLEEALSKAGGVKNKAAELVGIKRTTLIEKLKSVDCCNGRGMAGYWYSPCSTTIA